MMKVQTSMLIFFVYLLTANQNIFAQEKANSWTDYRGPGLNGYSYAKNIPHTWNDSTNVAWKTPIPGRGWSSPVIMNNTIWITTAPEDGKDLRLLSVDATTGNIQYNIKLFEVD
ncbi:MAG: PQQ-binding-like beta-propeller repeat protein, partial [Draconibacterium sp.]|nr:PQQ-binding-like beta-propeller repeat protein [Draconibacterium sp.]